MTYESSVWLNSYAYVAAGFVMLVWSRWTLTAIAMPIPILSAITGPDRCSRREVGRLLGGQNTRLDLPMYLPSARPNLSSANLGSPFVALHLCQPSLYPHSGLRIDGNEGQPQVRKLINRSYELPHVSA